MVPLPPLIMESRTIPSAEPGLMDRLWAEGWRHFGSEFFRYSLTVSEAGELQVIQPLRIDPAAFRASKSQRRVRRRNADADIRIVPAMVDAEREAMFFRHRERFVTNIPDSLRTFIPNPNPAISPCECFSVEVRSGGRLIAVSYFDVGKDAVSSVYALFEPDEAWRSAGTLTLLAEIEWAAARGKRWLYPGYATLQRSHYDYKKAFHPLEYFDWRGNWLPLK
jgi:leucyl-tRNA---protein transferase